MVNLILHMRRFRLKRRLSSHFLFSDLWSHSLFLWKDGIPSLIFHQRWHHFEYVRQSGLDLTDWTKQCPQKIQNQLGPFSDDTFCPESHTEGFLEQANFDLSNVSGRTLQIQTTKTLSSGFKTTWHIFDTIGVALDVLIEQSFLSFSEFL